MAHIYKKGGKGRNEPKFEKRYGKKKGDYVYGAVVGELARKRYGKRGAARRAAAGRRHHRR